MAKMFACLLSVFSCYNGCLYDRKDAAVASRKLSEIALTKLVDVIPELVGGSADLTGSNLTRWKGAVDFQPVHPHLIHFTDTSPPPNSATGPVAIFATEFASTPWKP